MRKIADISSGKPNHHDAAFRGVSRNWQYAGRVLCRGTRMEWLNYHHLLYFWTVAREGTIAKASEVLLLAPPTISEQIRELEGSLGIKLFRKQGRNLALT